MNKNNKNIKLLLVDDDEAFLMSTVPALEHRGFDVQTACTGEIALNQISKFKFDIILLDVKMPGIGGIETLNRIKKAYPLLPVVILTGHGSVDQAFKTSKDGVDGYLSKPFDMEKLTEQMQRLVLQAEKHTELPDKDKIVLLPADKIRALIVDDEKDFLESLTPVLSRRNMVISAAQNGSDALVLLKSTLIDVVVLDIKMPGMDGLDVLKKIKEEFPDVEVILLTGHSSVQNALNGIKLGAFEYLMKPPDIDELVELIRKSYLRREANLEKQRKKIVNDIRVRYPD